MSIQVFLHSIAKHGVHVKNTFPLAFWTGNVIELFGGAAYYAVASFIAIWLNQNFGMAPTKSPFFNGTARHGLIYFLLICSGALADCYGFKRSVILAFPPVTCGYLVMGNLRYDTNLSIAMGAIIGAPLCGMVFT